MEILKEVLIPLHEESLKKLDHKKKQVIVELPELLLLKRLI